MAFGLILDGYVDEPACFGVPPYVSPYVRALSGVLASRDLATRYVTCDDWRRSPRPDLVAEAAVTVVILGLTVPGRYRGGSPMTLKELRALAELPRQGALLVGGPIHRGYALKGGQTAVAMGRGEADCLAFGDPEAVLDHWLHLGEWDPGRRRTYRELDRWAPLGAAVVCQHPFHPRVVAELELSRGCDRVDGPCSFCTEGASPGLEERSVEGIEAEVRALAAAGVFAFRLGRCANLLGYGGTSTDRGRRPNPETLGRLYEALRRAAPGLRVLHGDNGNPQTLVRFPGESEAALTEMVRGNTPGDTLSLGLESLHPEVVRRNRLKVSFREALEAVRLVHRIGSRRVAPGELPSLLAGLNFLVGLPGETGQTLGDNRRFLETLLEEGLAVRRINIRRPMVFPGTDLAREEPSRVRDRDYRRFKEWVRSEVDPEMFRRVAPPGTRIREIQGEERRGKVLFGRPLGSYPPLVGLVTERLAPGDVVDGLVCGAGPRSLTAVACPLDPNRCGREELEALPGVGRARAERLLAARPLTSEEDLRRALDDPAVAERLRPFLFPRA